MSWDINHVVIVGRLTKDPELTYTQSGTAVCRFSIAVNRSSSSSRDNQEGNANFFNVVAWNKTAEICGEYLSKGRQVAIDGRLQQRRWEGTDGVKRNTVDIVATNVQFFGPARSAPGQYTQEEQAASVADSTSGSSAGGEPPAPLAVNEKAEERDPFLSELDDDEIPF
jgi:single-strand DNA-binding protein